ncbi:hypothetical protein HDV00_000369 [Rhizophlyctis rosea]|nr:hypothetical protein HDV00_000369 [Rhizophlyctis rosea]
MLGHILSPAPVQKLTVPPPTNCSQDEVAEDYEGDHPWQKAPCQETPLRRQEDEVTQTGFPSLKEDSHHGSTHPGCLHARRRRRPAPLAEPAAERDISAEGAFAAILPFISPAAPTTKGLLHSGGDDTAEPLVSPPTATSNGLLHSGGDDIAEPFVSPATATAYPTFFNGWDDFTQLFAGEGSSLLPIDEILHAENFNQVDNFYGAPAGGYDQFFKFSMEQVMEHFLELRMDDFIKMSEYLYAVECLVFNLSQIEIGSSSGPQQTLADILYKTAGELTMEGRIPA